MGRKGGGFWDGRSDTEGDTPSALVRELWGSNGVGEEVGDGMIEGDGVVPVVYLVKLTAVAIVVGSATGTVHYMSDRATCPFGFKSSDPTNVDDPSPSSPQPPNLTSSSSTTSSNSNSTPTPTTNLLPRLPELHLPPLRRCHPKRYLQETGGDAAQPYYGEGTGHERGVRGLYTGGDVGDWSVIYNRMETESKPKPRPVFAQKASLSELLKIGTVSHSSAESVHFVKEFIWGNIDHDLYSQLILNLYFVYETIKRLLDTHTPAAFPTLHYPKQLGWVETPRDDVDFFYGDNYLDRLEFIAHTEPLLLLSHTYTLYLGDLSSPMWRGRRSDFVLKRGRKRTGCGSTGPSISCWR